MDPAPNAYLEFRKQFLRPLERRENRFNDWLAIHITKVVGTMWCAYAFAALAFISLPAAIRGGTATLISWIAQTFLQLVLLPIIIVGQNVQATAADARAQATYDDAAAVLEEARQIQAHLTAQDEILERIIGRLVSST
jgi:hypothetical protein